MRKGKTQHEAGHCSLAVTHLMAELALGFVPKDTARARGVSSEMPSGDHFWHLLMLTVPPCSWKGEGQLLKFRI